MHNPSPFGESKQRSRFCKAHRCDLSRLPGFRDLPVLTNSETAGPIRSGTVGTETRSARRQGPERNGTGIGQVTRRG